MTITDLLNLLFPPSGKFQLTADQEKIIRHPDGPAWVLAGPGSGKTEVLAVMVLRLLFVEKDPAQPNRIPPESILVTTFTKKAARNLEDRISEYRTKVLSSDPSLVEIDTSKLRIGTLHGLCNDLLQEFRAPNYQNVRLMDKFEQELFVREHMSLVKSATQPAQMTFWKDFPWMFRPQQWKSTYSYPPNKWNSTKALTTLLNRMIEYRVDNSALRASGGQLQVLADLYDEYQQHLLNNYRCDFSAVQLRFLEFLKTPDGQRFRDGDGSDLNPGIQWVLVDEYQDTNPVQEEIYFEMAIRTPHNLMIVGDDDQAMYRFRGGSVECMVTFDAACNAFLGLPKKSVTNYPLIDNWRSHKDIVRFFDDYIGAFQVMQKPGARAPKPSIKDRRVISQTYPAVSRLADSNLNLVAEQFAKTVRGLINTNVVNDPSECCLLLKSAKDSPLNAGKYVEALKNEGLNVYNPRNKSFAEQEEVQGLLGTILAIVDPTRRYATDPANRNFVPGGEAGIRDTYDKLAAKSPGLANYVSSVTSALKKNAGQSFDSNLQELAYYILSLDPFNTWQQDPVRRSRLAVLTKLLEAYGSMPVLDQSTGLPRTYVHKKTGQVLGLISRGFLRASSHHPGEVINAWLSSFYNLFLGYVLDAGIDDEEDEDVIVPQGMVPIMTMHQAKGLEFPFVFVGHMGETANVSSNHELETLFSKYPANPARIFSHAPPNERAEMDLIRQYYVAYSRAEYALVLLGSNGHFNKHAIPQGPIKHWVSRRTNLL